MNPIEQLRADLAGRFPDHATDLAVPLVDCGSWFLDVHRGGGLPPVVVEWRPDQGFGVSTPDGADYGMGPDEVYPEAKAAYDRVVRLVLSAGKSVPPRAVRLGELRQGLGLSQTELTERAGMKQANLSRIENRGDVLVSTLAGIVGAMGAELVILARFPGPEGREIEIRLPTVQSELGSALTARSIWTLPEGSEVPPPSQPSIGGYRMTSEQAPPGWWSKHESTPPTMPATAPEGQKAPRKKKAAPKRGESRPRRTRGES